MAAVFPIYCSTGCSTNSRPIRTELDRPAPFSSAERESLYADFLPLVRRLIRQYGDTHELREDLEGEIYWRFCSLLDEFDPERGVPLKAYLVRKLIASVYTFARSQWRRQQHEVVLDSEYNEIEYIRVEDPTQEWTHQLVKEEVGQALYHAVEQLPSRQRQVIFFRYYEDRSYEEIAARLSITEATARSLARHGINGLRRYLASLGLSMG